MADRLRGKVALVTGGGAGIGEAIARRFHGEGAEVLVNDLHKAAAERVASAVGGTALVADVSDSAAVRRMFEEVADRCGRLDVLVNNAGIGGHEGNPQVAQEFARVGLAQMQEAAAGGPIRTHCDTTVNLSDEDWLRMLAVHLNGTFFCTREALKIMGPQGSGVILNLGSIMGTAGGAGAPAYCAAKAGILGFTRSVAREVVTRGIRVNALAPGWIESSMTAPLAPLRPVLELQTPMRRFGEADDIAWAAVYLASDEAKFVTGQVLSPNGGWHMSQ
ncbi:MAG TPA: SDR family oxidoreductase [Myxococcota bacterium]|jgi:3-oxoacyl-[acyl-carrier protein] reductase|nr:SDR family oxidoreductase [Myxococcota bacterium]